MVMSPGALRNGNSLPRRKEIAERVGFPATTQM
jgi:hypothetical protein